MTAKIQSSFFLLRYVPDAVKNEFVNVGVVLLPQGGLPEVRFTHDWSRVKCLDAEADVDLLQALETDLRDKLRDMDGDREFILRRIQDSFSNAVQPSESKACLAESPVKEADELARLYLERPRRRAGRGLGPRQMIYQRMQEEFQHAGVWPVLERNIRASNFTRSGDPLKIDCGYASNGSVKLFHAVSIAGDADKAKLLAFTFPRLAEGIRKKQNKVAHLTTIVEDDLDRDSESVGFALETLEQQTIAIAPLAQMPQIAAAAARELGVM